MFVLVSFQYTKMRLHHWAGMEQVRKWVCCYSVIKYMCTQTVHSKPVLWGLNEATSTPSDKELHGCAYIIDIESLQNRLLKVCYVPATSTSLPRLPVLLQPLKVLMKHTRQAVIAIKQSILLRCLWLPMPIVLNVEIVVYTQTVPWWDKMPAWLYYIMGCIEFHRTLKSIMCWSFKTL
jgi:hypothetical protein